jgi:hypothetical protein
MSARRSSDLSEAAILERDLRKATGILARRRAKVTALRAKLRIAEKEYAQAGRNARMLIQAATTARQPAPEAVYAPPEGEPSSNEHVEAEPF